jgi:hypothetical protein
MTIQRERALMTTLGGELTAAAAAAASAVEQQQLELLDYVPSRFQPESTERAELATQIKRDRAGRPPGSRNLMTRQMVDFIRKTIGDPLLERARWAMHTPESLAKELGCSKFDAFILLDKIRADLAPYMYPRMAPTDEHGNAVVPHFSMQVGVGTSSAGADDKPPWAYLDELNNEDASTPGDGSARR